MPPGSDVAKNGAGNLANGSTSRSRRTTILPAPDSSQLTQATLKRRKSEPKPCALPPPSKRREYPFPEMAGVENVAGGDRRVSETSDTSDRSGDAKKNQNNNNNQKPSKNGRRRYPAAEIYSKKLYTQMASGIDIDENSDTEIEGSSKQAILTDQWKPEFSWGTQELANGHNLPQMKTQFDDFWLPDKPDFQFPAKMIACDVTATYFDSSVYQTPPISPQSYEITAQDEIYVAKLNENRRMDNNRTYLEIETLRKIFTQFEEAVFIATREKILDELHSVYIRPPEHGSREEELVPCDICGDADCGADDEMIFCDMCNTCVHCSCAGIMTVPPSNSPWKCLKCAVAGIPAPPCVLCPVLGGSMVCDEEQTRWAHHVCALFHPEVGFGDASTRQPIRDLEKILPERLTAICSVCDTSQGATIECVEPGCEEQFHVCCALRAGLTVRIVEKSGLPDSIFRETRCHRHTTEPHKLPAVYKGQFSECRNPRLAEKQQAFFLYTDYEQVAMKLNLEEIIVSDVYEYWKLRRLANDCRPLIPKLHHRLKIEPVIERAAQRAVDKLADLMPDDDDSHAGQFFPRAALMVTEMRQHHLKRVRSAMEADATMLKLLEQREQLKLKKVQLENQVVRLAAAAVKKIGDSGSSSAKSDRLSFPDDMLEKAWKIPKELIKKAQSPENFARYLRELNAEESPKKPSRFYWPSTPEASKSPLRPRNSGHGTPSTSSAPSSSSRAAQKPRSGKQNEGSEEDTPPAKRRCIRSSRVDIGSSRQSSPTSTSSATTERSALAPPTCSSSSCLMLQDAQSSQDEECEEEQEEEQEDEEEQEEAEQEELFY